MIVLFGILILKCYSHVENIISVPPLELHSSPSIKLKQKDNHYHTPRHEKSWNPSLHRFKISSKQRDSRPLKCKPNETICMTAIKLILWLFWSSSNCTCTCLPRRFWTNSTILVYFVGICFKDTVVMIH